VIAAHGQGPPRSTVADAIASIVYHYRSIATRGAYAANASYAVNDTVSSDGRVYRCFVAGTSTGPGPTGMGSQRDGNGVGWTPLVYVGERYLKQHGAPPRIVIVPGNGAGGDAATTSVKRIGDGNISHYAADVTAYLWAAESNDDLARYTAIEDAIDAFINCLNKVATGRKTVRVINPTITANIVTFGEDRQIVASYQRGVPRDAAIWDVPVEPAPTLDIMRPNGDLGTEYTVDPNMNGSR
jgi:hypothetical protein